jgi:GH43 family beta-xylosidase
MVGQIGTPDNNWAIDGTILKYGNGKLYFLWSGWSNAQSTLIQNLYIAEMDGPTRTKGNRVLLHEPTPAWQRSGSSGVNEGPEILVNAGRTFLIYCAYSTSHPACMTASLITVFPTATAGSWTQDYNLAMMGIDNLKDPRTLC